MVEIVRVREAAQIEAIAIWSDWSKDSASTSSLRPPRCAGSVA
jgi:hypothetical protein